MELVTGKLNNVWLRNILNSSSEAIWVKAAIAYANDESSLIDFCFEKNIPLEYFGRYDCSVPVKPSLLRKFLNKKSFNHVCKVIPDIFHPKVIWWGGYGAYIGSANLTDRAWNGNIECGIFLTEIELINNGMDLELERFFEHIDEYARPVTEEIINELERFNRERQELENKLILLEAKQTRSLTEQKSLVHVALKAKNKAEEKFKIEWNETLQILRDISDLIYKPENIPKWVPENTSKGILADQFLHAYYYSYPNIMDGRKSLYREFFEKHEQDKQKAIQTAIEWWKALEKAPNGEDKIMSNYSEPNKKILDKSNLMTITLADFIQLCLKVHAIRDHARKMDNAIYGLPKAQQKSSDECVELFAKFLWQQKSVDNKSVIDVIYYALYDSSGYENLPNRLWEVTHDSRWKIPHLGIGILGELVGWAIPDRFVPRNGRTNKALHALGFGVTLY